MDKVDPARQLARRRRARHGRVQGGQAGDGRSAQVRDQWRCVHRTGVVQDSESPTEPGHRAGAGVSQATQEFLSYTLTPYFIQGYGLTETTAYV